MVNNNNNSSSSTSVLHEASDEEQSGFLVATTKTTTATTEAQEEEEEFCTCSSLRFRIGDLSRRRCQDLMLNGTIFLNLMVLLLVVLQLRQSQPPRQQPFISNKNNTKMAPSAPTDLAPRGWIRPSTVYGLVHMAKTAGTEINGEWACHFERVCGNKGYSYDILETNRRFQDWRNDPHHEPKVLEAQADLHDAVGKVYGSKRNRARVPMEWMQEIGFEDCDYMPWKNRATCGRNSLLANGHWNSMYPVGNP